MIYLDHNATTPVEPEVAEAMAEAQREGFGNPSSCHLPGVRARQFVETARSRVAGLLGARQEEIYFTSGGTESNNLAILGLARRRPKGHVVTSAVEHPSVIQAVRYLLSQGFQATLVGVDGDGRVRVDEVERAIRDDTVLITVMHSNNETGVLQPIEDIARLARSRKVPFHTDAAQSVGKVPVSAEACDMLTVAGHKLYGPKGVGALYVRRGIALEPILFGAGHEKGLRPGTENVSGVVGLGVACELAGREREARGRHVEALAERFLSGLRRNVSALRLNGHPALRLPGTLNLCCPGVDSTSLTAALGDRIAMSSGSACHAGERKPSAVLMAMGVSEDEALSSVRFSLGKDNTEEEMDRAVRILSETLAPPAPAR
ncbi:MAG: cysteine desulfurase family protein [Nitrospirota bacterium]